MRGGAASFAARSALAPGRAGVPPAPAGILPASNFSGAGGPTRGLLFTSGEDALEGGRDARPTYADETMKPTSESLSPPATRAWRVAKGNCVAAKRGGEYPEAKDRSQTQVNSIRPLQGASWRRNRICRGELRGVLAKPEPMAQPTDGTSRVQAGRSALWGGWSENGRRYHGLSQDRCRRAETVVDDRAPIVALKRVTTVERRGVGR